MSRRPDVQIAGWAHANTIRFRTKPIVRTGGAALPGGEHDSGSERENLPDRVQRGRVYRDAGIVAWVRERIANP